MSGHLDDLLSAYMDDECTENERQQVEEHIHHCPECAAMLCDLMDMKHQAFSAFYSIEAPQTLEQTVIQAIRAEAGATSSMAQKRYWLLAPLVSALLLLAVAFAFTGTFMFKMLSIGFKVVINLVYAIGGLLGSDPYWISGLALFSVLIIIGSSVSLKRLVKAKVI